MSTASTASTEPPEVSLADYRKRLKAFDIALCEALAVGQATSGRFAATHVGMGTYVFARICGHAVAMMRAAPLTRWSKSSWHHWDFSAVSGHARSIIEGFLLLRYTIKKPYNEDEVAVRINLMHLNDCSRRVKLMRDLGADPTVFDEQLEELRDRLKETSTFSNFLPYYRIACSAENT